MGLFKLKRQSAPDTPASGFDSYYTDSTSGFLSRKDDNGDIITYFQVEFPMASVASAANLELLTSNKANVTGTVQIDNIKLNTITENQTVVLKFEDIVLVKNNTAGAGKKMMLESAGDFTTTANDSLTLVYDGTNFIELSRSVN